MIAYRVHHRLIANFNVKHSGSQDVAGIVSLDFHLGIDLVGNI